MPDTASLSDASDKLFMIFAMQKDLNDYIFSKQGLRDTDGNPLTIDTISHAAVHGQHSVNDLPNQWLVRYSKAIDEELKELNSALLWKWWSKDAIDLQNIRVELVDLLHFLVSAMLCAGFTSEILYDIYQQKHKINIARQDTGYSKTTKTEEDNKSVK